MSKKKSKYEEQRVFIINDPQLRLVPRLAQKIGVWESVLLLQLEFCISRSEPLKIKNGRRWTYQSLSDLETYLPFLTRETIRVKIKSLEEKKLIEIGNYNTRRGDKTQWFALNLEEVAKLPGIKVDVDALKEDGEAVRKSDRQDEAAQTENLIDFSNNLTADKENLTTLPEKTLEKTQRESERTSGLLVSFHKTENQNQTPQEKRERFEKWFKFFPRHEQKEKSYKKFMELELWNGEYDQLIAATRNFINRTENYPPNMIRMPVNFLIRYKEEL